MTKDEAMRVLEITDYDYTDVDLKKALRKASKKHHPDLGGSAQMMMLVNEAYAFLSNPANNKRLSVTHDGILNVVCC